MRLRSSAPTRLDFAGGTLDIWPLYLFHDRAQTLNAAINIRASCTISSSDDGALHVVSEDTGGRLDAARWSDLSGLEEPRLLSRILRFFEAEAVTVVTRSESPVGAGLAGSSALTIAVCGALARWQQRTCSDEELMAIALNLEAQVLGIPTGGQDYRPAMFGGIAAIEMGVDGVHRRPVPVDPHALARRLVVAYTGQSRDSGINNWEIIKRHLDGDRRIVELFDQIRDVAEAMRHALAAEDWPEVGQQLGREWALRKDLAPGVTTPTIDTLVNQSLQAGATAAKVCGAGGGGCVLFLVDPTRTAAVRDTLSASGATLLDVAIDTDGLQVRID